MYAPSPAFPFFPKHQQTLFYLVIATFVFTLPVTGLVFSILGLTYLALRPVGRILFQIGLFLFFASSDPDWAKATAKSWITPRSNSLVLMTC